MKIAVYGMGRFGQFWARTLIDAGFDVVGYNRSARPIDPAIMQIPLEEIASCDVLFLCTAISSVEEVAKNLAKWISKDCIVADTCSVKLHPLNALEANLPPGQPIFGTHPMFGPDSARHGIQGLPLVLTPWTAADVHVNAWDAHFRRMGLEVHNMSAEQHDREAARTQGVTHFIGRFLSALELAPSAIGTVGYTKIFEVMEQTCNDPWQLFVDLQRYNPFSVEIRGTMKTKFTQLIEELEHLDRS